MHYLLAYWLGHYSEEPAELRDYNNRHAAKLLGWGSFCCECRAQKASLEATTDRPAGPALIPCASISVIGTVRLHPLSDYATLDRGRRGPRLPYASLSEAEIAEALRRIH